MSTSGKFNYLFLLWIIITAFLIFEISKKAKNKCIKPSPREYSIQDIGECVLGICTVRYDDGNLGWGFIPIQGEKFKEIIAESCNGATGEVIYDMLHD